MIFGLQKYNQTGFPCNYVQVMVEKRGSFVEDLKSDDMLARGTHILATPRLAVPR